MVDLPGRPKPRFPAELVDAAGAEIERRIRRHTADRVPGNVKGFASLARGGDILFHEVCRKLGFETVIVLPFSPETFLKTSVEGAAGGEWEKRFWTLWDETPLDRRHDLKRPESDEPYVACNEVMLDLAFGWGQVQLITLWDESTGDGPGGTAHFIEEVKQKSGQQPEIINPKNLY
jgi:hypothetical protein